MSNTVIQIKRSLTNAQPSSLSVAELGYSYLSNTMFIGTPDGTGTIAVGGKSFFDLINSSFGIANAAYNAANNAGSLEVINTIFTTTNSAYTVANAAYGFANTTYSNYAYPAYVRSSAAFDVANAAFGKVNTVATSANAYATAVGASSNAYANSTFVKLVAGSQTITGDLAITGNLTFTGNATTIVSQELYVGDSLIYLAANNYSGTDVLDIGFIANYGNTSGSNVHTGLVRDATTKEYYLFQGYDREPANNTFVPGANNMVNAVLHADFNTSNLTLGGANAIVWLTSAFNTTNAAYDQANTLAISTNAYALSVATEVGAAGNAWANVVGASSNAWANVVGTSGNAFAVVVGAASNTWANTLNTAIHQTFHDAANITSGILPSARISGDYTGITGVGTITTGTWRGSTVNVGYGGTGIVSATLNGILFGGGGNAAFQVTAAGTEGQVLTASATGVPQFEMLSGGTF